MYAVEFYYNGELYNDIVTLGELRQICKESELLDVEIVITSLLRIK